LFKNAIVYVQENTIRGDIYEFFSIQRSVLLAPNTRIIQTPGHSIDDITVLAETKKGVYAAVGDIYWFGQNDKSEFVLDEIKLKESRKKIMALSDYIIPGHAGLFKVEK